MLAKAGVREPRTAGRARKALIWASGALALLAGIGWAGLQIQPAPFPPIQAATAPVEMMAIPAGLPAPVERFYRVTYGDQMPVPGTVVVTGRGTMRLEPLFNLTFPMRFRFTHQVGQSYRHYFELTFLGLPIFKANEYYHGGKERMETPFGVDENNPKLDQGGNLGMWAELLQWTPAGLFANPRVRWEPLDGSSARLVVPFGNDADSFVVKFDEATGEIAYWETMRYKNGQGDKILWRSGTWMDDGKPWLFPVTEGISLNVPVDTSFAAKGP
jgi:uncharacterized protein DUF6544